MHVVRPSLTEKLFILPRHFVVNRIHAAQILNELNLDPDIPVFRGE